MTATARAHSTDIGSIGVRSSDGVRWSQILLGVVCMVAAANIQYAWTLFVPEIQKTFGWQRAAIQTAFTIFVIVQTWLTPLEGYLIDKYGPRLMVFFGGLLTGASWVVDSFATSLTQFYIASAIGGVGVGCVYATCVNSAMKWFPDRRGLAVGLTAGGYGAGSALTIIPIANMIAGGGFQKAFFWFGLAQGLIIMVASLGLRAPQAGETKVSQSIVQSRKDFTLTEALGTPLFYVLFAMFILTVTGGLMAVAQLGPMAQDLGVKDTQINFGLFAMAALPFALLLDRIMNGASRPLFGWISDHIGRENTMFIAFTLEGLGIIALAVFGSNPWAFVILSGVVFIAWGEVYSLYSATSADAFGTKNIGSIYGVLYCAKGIAALLVPVGNLIMEASGSWSTVLYIVAAMDLMSALCAVLVLKPLLKRHHHVSAHMGGAGGGHGGDLGGSHAGTSAPAAATSSRFATQKQSEMAKALSGIRIIDFTHVQAGPACTQLLAWFGADVIKVERPGSGDVTRNQLRDMPDADALYFTMLNSNKRSLTLDTKTTAGKEVLEKLIKVSDVMVENFGPGALDRMGFTWQRIMQLNPKMILASVKGFSDGHHYEDLKVYENVAQCAGGAASTTGWWDGPPTVSAAALGDSNTGMHLAIGILTALRQRDQTGKGQRVAVSMQDSVLNLCRVKLRDQQRLDRVGYLEEYPQYPHGSFSDVVPRGGNAGGGGQPGWVLKCKGWETDANAYIYFTIQGHAWAPICDAIGKPEWKTDPAYMTAPARQPHIQEIFDTIEGWLADKTKFEAVDILRKFDIPCSPVLSMKEIAIDPSLRASGTVVEVDHKVRGKYLTVGSPIKFSGMTVEVTGSPLLGEHSEEVLAELGYSRDKIAAMREAKAI